MSKIYLEILDKKRLETFQKLSVFTQEGYLAGGTALALQINHRVSFDFDIFVGHEISNKLRLKVKDVFGKHVQFDVNSSDQMTFTIESGSNITFLWYYFKQLKPSIKTSIISLASIEDISADKAYTIGRRAAWRDYVDLFYILKTNILSLDKVIVLAKKKFEGEFNETLFLEQLSYFNDLDVAPIDWIHKSYTEKEIKTFLENQIEGYVKKQLQ